MLSTRKSALILAQITFVAIVPAAHAADNKSTTLTYLALGDSVAFGLNPYLLPPISNQKPSPNQFTGYPEIIGQVERLPSSREVNASCPGETSASFLSDTVTDLNPDNGCRSPHLQLPAPLPPFKTAVGLHTNYAGSQMAFAISQLTSNKGYNLVTLNIGSNDVLLALALCKGDLACAGPQFPAILNSFAGNLTTILMKIRAVYSGKLVLVTYYAPTPEFDSLAQGLNQVIVGVGKPFGVEFADGYNAFRLVASLFGGDACKAGLVYRLPDGTCDVHPTPAGQGLLAGAVELAMHH